MKVQSQPQAAAIQQANPTRSAEGTAGTAKVGGSSTGSGSGFVQGSAGQAAARFQDGFEQRKLEPGEHGIIDCFPPFPQQKDSLGLGDRLTAGKLPEALNNPLNQALLQFGEKDVVLSRDPTGMMRGPEGQPLAQVKLDDGTTAYVDANTNQYYLSDEPARFGRTNAVGPLTLPEGSQFSNSYFSDAEVRSIERAAQGGGGWPFPGPIEPLPYPPRPFPFPVDPLPLPRLPEDWLGPIKNFDPSVLLASGAGKASGNE